MAGRLTTHALDTVLGRGASGLAVRLVRVQPDPSALTEVTLNAEGRAVVLEEEIPAGVYQLEFAVAAYHRATGTPIADPPFLDTVVVRFTLAATMGHCHVPLLFSPYAYSTYLGT